jgi:hypothetical protein
LQEDGPYGSPRVSPGHGSTPGRNLVPGDRRLAVSRRAGPSSRPPPQRPPSNQPLEPIGEDFYDIGGPGYIHLPNIAAAGKDETLRYRRLVVSVTDGKVTVLGTTDERARTPDGVGVGDSQDLVKERYPRARRFIQNEGTEYTTYPLCKTRVCKGRVLAFGGDPIRSLWLAAETRAGLESCRRP